MFNNVVIGPILDVIRTFGEKYAFHIGGNYFTYNQLAKYISKIRNELRIETLTDDKNIGLIIDDNIETYASIIAIWLEGKAYVPINPDSPLDRNNNLINQAEIKTILSTSKVPIKLERKVIFTDLLEEKALFLIQNNVPDSELAYIFFTSGTTGEPKGVPITRGNIEAFVSAFWDLGYTIDENDRCLQPFDLTFDLSVMSYLIPLLKGACVYTVPSNQIKYSYIAQLLEENMVTFALMVPSTIRFLKPYFDELNFPSLKYSLFCGEALPLDLTQGWSKCAPNAIIDNVYGPTEDTIFCSQYRYVRDNKNKTYNGILSIGKSMTSGEMIIVNEKNEEVETGEHGELCLTGGQLTPGYWKNPQKNKDVFFLNNQGKRFYKTGDICFKDIEGDIMYVNRIDSQVKVQGFRIELGEIEFHVREFLKGINAAAVAFENISGNTELALFIEGQSINTNELYVYLKSKLPHYMIPANTLFCASFPLNSNGKTDRKELKRLI